MKIRKATLASTAVLALACACMHGAANAADDAAAKFAARETVRSVSISPEGKQLVFVAARPDGGENAIVVNLATGGAKAVFSSKGIDEQITSCSFVLEERVVCRAYFRQGSNRNTEGASRLVSIAADGSDMKMLTAQTAATAYYNSNFGGRIIDYSSADEDSVLMMSWKPEEMTTGTLTARRGHGLLVEQVNVESAKRKQMIAPNPIAFDYISDGSGNVRIMASQRRGETGYAGNELEYRYRAIGESGWHELSQVTVKNGIYYGFEPIAVDSDKNVVYGFESNGDNSALFEISLDGSNTKRLVLAKEGADIDTLLRIGRSRRVIGASYATDYRHVDYFDPKYASLSSALGRALGGDKQIAIIDADSAEEKLVLVASNDVEPGDYYIFDNVAKKLSPLMSARPELKGMEFGHMKPVRFPAADGTMIPAYLTLPPGSDGKNLPAIVMPHGGPSSRDEWGFDWLVQYFANQGFAVLQPNYRGSSGFGTNWFQQNGFQSWPTAIGDIDDAGRWLTAEGIAAPGKLAIFGWSYGGYAALQSAVTEPGLYKVVVAVAPVTDLQRLVNESSDSVNHKLVEDFVGTGPHVDAGSPAQHAERVAVPVMLFHGDADTNVYVAHSRLMRDKLAAAGKDVNYVEFDGLAHSLDESAARTRLLGESSKFIRKALGIAD